jgi:hypothetical protein
MPIATTCPACSKTYKLNDNLAGKRVKCPCGSMMNVAGAATTAAAATRPAATRTVAAATAAPVLTAPRSSIFDELTENDFNRSPYAPPAPMTVNTRGDANYLKRFTVADDGVVKKETESKGWFIFLGVVHIIWAMIYCAGAVLFMVASAALVVAEDSLPMLKLGLAVVAVAFLFAALSTATGIGILMYKPWGWWLGVYSMFWGIFDRISAIALGLLDGGTDSNRISQYVVLGVAILGCISFLQLFCAARSRKTFNVQTPPWIALVICGVAAFVVIGTISLVIYLTGESLDEEVALMTVRALVFAA